MDPRLLRVEVEGTFSVEKIIPTNSYKQKQNLFEHGKHWNKEMIVYHAALEKLSSVLSRRTAAHYIIED